jgi:hypothetical protein
MTYALPVALATWFVVTWQFIKLNREIERRAAQQTTAVHVR